MLKVSYDIDDDFGCICPIVLIDYDGARFSLLQLDDDVWQVMVKRRDEWCFFGHKLYRSFVEATEAIFYDIMLDRFESGWFIRDESGHIVGHISLSYYDRCA